MILFKKISKNKPLVTIILSIIIFLIVLFFSRFFDTLNTKFKNWILNSKNEVVFSRKKGNMLSKNLVLIEIDEKTYNQNWYPLPRRDYAQFIKNANKAWALIIWFDVFFVDENKLDPEWDIVLANAIKDAWNIVLWWPIDWDKIVKPLPEIYTWALWFWYYRPNVHPNTNQVSSFLPEAELKDNLGWNLEIYNHFSIVLLKAYFSKYYSQNFINYHNSDNTNYYIKPWYKVPFYWNWKKSVLINFLPPNKVKSYSFLDVYNGNLKEDELKDKIVILWVTAAWIKDIFVTANWKEFWVTVHWNIVNTILTKNFLVYINRYVEFLLLFLLIIVSVYFNLSRSSYALLFSNIAIIVIFIITYTSITVIWNFILTYIIELIFALILSLTLSNILKYLTENKNKVLLSKALSEYVSQAVAHEILTNSWEINLNWEEKKLAMYFSDIEWFTTISEKFNAQELVAFLREYLSEMSDIIMDEKWFVNKYEWDAIMWLWWSFNNYDFWATHACKTAIKQQEKLKQLNTIWKEKWFDEVRVRIWLHIWNAIVWNIGSSWRKMEYTALWDNVNLASRLEWVNKYYWTYICVSEDVYAETKTDFEFRYLDEIRVKWKTKPVKIFELISYKWEIEKDKQVLIKDFENAIKLYKNRDFENAKNEFKKTMDTWDLASSVYFNRCKNYIKNPALEDWDWVHNMTSK